jgi:regulator of nonsense transcripts 1
MRSRVSVRAVAAGTPFADLRGGALLSPAARRDPEKAREERRKLWERLGANSSTNAGFAHLLETPSNFERETSESSSDESSSENGFNKRVGSGRGSSGTRQRGSSRATLRLGFTAHREKYAKALRLELEEEMARAEERLESWPKERLAKEGYALFNLRGLHDGNLQRDAVVRVLIPRGREPLAMPEPLEGAKNGDEGERRPFRRQFAMGAELPFHRFGQGDMVSLVEGDEHDPSGKNAVTGVVVERAMHFLKIAVDEEDEEKLLCAGKLRLDLSANTVSHDRALAALAAFSEQGGMPGYDVSSLQTGKRLSSSMYAPLQRAAIGIPDGDPKTPREGRESVARLAATPPPWAGKDASGAVKRAVNGTRAATLNASQQTAVRRALTRTLSVWQGPPGTGKTRALCAYVEACVFFARDETKNGSRKNNAGFSGPAVLACAASNVAVDNIVDGLVGSDTRVGVGNNRRPLRVVRLGSPAKVQAKLVNSTLGAQAALTPLGVKASAIRAAARGDYTAKGASARRLALQLETQAAQFVLRNADVVCATCVGAGDDALEGFTFRVACVDEAAQCPEPAALIPITKALSAVLVGDAKQLPPTVTSVDAQRAGLVRLAVRAHGETGRRGRPFGQAVPHAPGPRPSSRPKRSTAGASRRTPRPPTARRRRGLRWVRARTKTRRDPDGYLPGAFRGGGRRPRGARERRAQHQQPARGAFSGGGGGRAAEGVARRKQKRRKRIRKRKRRARLRERRRDHRAVRRAGASRARAMDGADARCGVRTRRELRRSKKKTPPRLRSWRCTRWTVSRAARRKSSCSARRALTTLRIWDSFATIAE